MSARADTHSSSAKRVQLDAEVQQHSLAAIRLCRHINAGTYVMRLPDELLENILSIYIGMSTHSSRRRPPDFGWGLPYWWIRVTHVCHRLRTVALNTPRLWANIAVTDSEPVKASIARSGNVPLQIVLDETAEEPDDVVSLWHPIFCAAHRVRSLCIRLRHGWNPNFPIATDVPTFTALRVLKLDYNPSRRPIWGHLLPPFVPHDLPRLHTLYACWMPYAAIQPLILPSLKTLSLSNVQMPDSMGWRPFLEALRGMPTLEDLIIQKCMFPLPREYLHLPLLADTVVTLPALRVFKVSCHVTLAGAALLLRNLRFPGDVRVEFGETGWNDIDNSSPLNFHGRVEGDVAQCVLSALQYRLSGRDGLATPVPQVVSLHLDVQEGDELSFKGWDALPLAIDPETSPDTQSALRFDVSCWPGASMADSFLGRLNFAPSFFGVKEITISCSPGETDITFPTESLLSGFALLPEVQTVLTSGSPAVGPVLTALRTPHGPEKRLSCPSLRTLHISRFSFAHVCADFGPADRTMGYIVPRKNGFECVKRMITIRNHHGLPINSLVITDCEISQVEWIQQLRELVREVVWDGVVSRETSEEPWLS